MPAHECVCNWGERGNERLTEVKRLLCKSENYVDQTPGRDGITGLQHALRTAGLGRDYGFHEDSAFIGLIHDLARPLNDVHHGEVMAEMVRDRASDDAYHILRTHGEFQSAVVHKTPWPHQDAPWFKIAKQLAAFELRSFDTDYDGPVMAITEALELLEEYLG